MVTKSIAICRFGVQKVFNPRQTGVNPTRRTHLDFFRDNAIGIAVRTTFPTVPENVGSSTQCSASMFSHANSTLLYYLGDSSSRGAQTAQCILMHMHRRRAVVPARVVSTSTTRSPQPYSRSCGFATYLPKRGRCVRLRVKSDPSRPSPYLNDPHRSVFCGIRSFVFHR